jgi:hypothetical protein
MGVRDQWPVPVAGKAHEIRISSKYIPPHINFFYWMSPAGPKCIKSGFGHFVGVVFNVDGFLIHDQRLS